MIIKRELFGPFGKGIAKWGRIYSVYKITAEESCCRLGGWSITDEQYLQDIVVEENIKVDEDKNAELLCSAVTKALPDLFEDDIPLMMEGVFERHWAGPRLREWIVRNMETFAPIAKLLCRHFCEPSWRQPEVTENALRTLLLEGIILDDILPTRSGQQGVIFKAKEFKKGNTVLYIPDYALHDICSDKPIHDVVDMTCYCYTGDDFVRICGGNEAAAERLFHFCDWQCPESAFDEDQEGFLADDENEEE